MKILILGGTAWLGHAIAASALAAGHDVTCVARTAGVPAGATLVRADRDDDAALSAVTDTHWDAVIDVSRQPGQVRRAVRDLEAVSDRYIFVSTVNVYATHSELDTDESEALLEPLSVDALRSPEDYGPAKVACEHAVLSGFGADRSAIVRAGLIGGPGDPSGRTGYWALRFANPSNVDGRVLVPVAPDLPAALIDVRDLAQWLVRLAEGAATGTFNAVGQAFTFDEHLETARHVAGHRGDVIAVAAEWLDEHGVAEWSGPRSMPLWLTDSSSYGMNTRSSARALAAGLVRRPLADTLADSLVVDRDLWPDGVHGAGLTHDEERTLLAELDAG
jgi:2'-hydroxyisoflavone reductase